MMSCEEWQVVMAYCKVSASWVEMRRITKIRVQDV